MKFLTMTQTAKKIEALWKSIRRHRWRLVGGHDVHRRAVFPPRALIAEIATERMGTRKNENFFFHFSFRLPRSLGLSVRGGRSFEEFPQMNRFVYFITGNPWARKRPVEVTSHHSTRRRNAWPRSFGLGNYTVRRSRRHKTESSLSNFGLEKSPRALQYQQKKYRVKVFNK